MAGDNFACRRACECMRVDASWSHDIHVIPMIAICGRDRGGASGEITDDDDGIFEIVLPRSVDRVCAGRGWISAKTS